MSISKNTGGWSPWLCSFLFCPYHLGASAPRMLPVHLEYHYFRLKINKTSLQRSKRMWFRFNCAIEAHLKWHKRQIHTFVEIGRLNRNFTVFWQSTFLIEAGTNIDPDDQHVTPGGSKLCLMIMKPFGKSNKLKRAPLPHCDIIVNFDHLWVRPRKKHQKISKYLIFLTRNQFFHNFVIWEA